MRQPIVVSGLTETYRRRAGGKWAARRGVEAPVVALQDVAFTIPAGTVAGVVGGNGSGKSTLLRVLAGILPPSRGSVEVAPPVGWLIDLPLGQDRDLSGYEFIDVTAVLHGSSRRQARLDRDAIAEATGLSPDELSEPTRTFSAGMVVRLEVAVVLHRRPSVIVLDEILAAADDGFQRRTLNRIRECADAGSAAVVASHDLEMLSERCDRLLVLDHGRLIHDGDVATGLRLHTERVDSIGGSTRS